MEKQTQNSTTMNQWDHLRVEKNLEKKTATIVLDRPEKMNTLSFIARSHLSQIFDQLNEDDDVRVIILKGEGTQAFSSGGTIAQFMERHPEELSVLHKNVAAPERSPKPVIAQLQGYTFGVGLEIAMSCDFRIASETTLLALPEIKLGMIPGSGGTQRIARFAGLGRAKDMIMRGRRIPAAEAYQWGLVTTVVPQENLEQAVSDLVDELVQSSPLALRVLKQVLNASQEGPLSAGLEIEGYAYGMLRSTHDFREGVDAFQEKRKPNFKGL
ncbi:enoyl-CoA hydratase-related protein [Brevibacillus agri]|uniref:enoyl-CoA hydratase/isomerase family protein n=1 Tax=Brevibacillus agri TaxID=51101 RepID=UPI002E1A64C9|nr:enoyl-CoA hydratase-related protein [Brevibacillus agri]MED1644421.1 enoyl-CoA hydratase-related protein [Brevibacillus agri]MED1657213.1 enoyl-CoA hydratase-related protein [Brevibacillus agri]MED1689622.1 enoyl-CoA hydratase-related protein [Brevibacillus agri]MED1693908.1 enoyl-CoA hydratase-related protein [Brevibacillus agri]MED1698284.1 enoyl-CoA hydratase-related protein [Brevibacillus agri]